MIVDASVAVKWFTVEPLHDEARALLTGVEPLAAPDILAVEFANAMWAKVRRNEMDEADAALAIAAVAGHGQPQLHPSAPLVTRAFELAREFDYPVYDCIYVALAEALDTELVTADRRFANAASLHARVYLLGGPG